MSYTPTVALCSDLVDRTLVVTWDESWALFDRKTGGRLLTTYDHTRLVSEGPFDVEEVELQELLDEVPEDFDWDQATPLVQHHLGLRAPVSS